MNGIEGQNDQSSLGQQPGPQGQSPQGEGSSGHPSNRPEQGDGGTDNRQDSDGGSGQQPEDRRFSQADVDRIAADRARKAERRAEQRAMRLLGNQSRQGQAPQRESQQRDEPEQRLTRQHFASDDDWIDYRVQQGLKAERSAREQSERHAANERVAERVMNAYQDAERLDGFDREDYDALDLTPAITHAVLDADTNVRGPLMLYLQQHPDEVTRISRMNPIQQAKAIGRIETKLETTGNARDQSADRQQMPSRAPRPGTNVGGGNSGQTTGDLSRSSMSDYVRARARQGAKWASR